MKKILSKFVSRFTIALSLLALSPIIASAAGPCDSTITGFMKLICPIQDLLNAIVPVLVALGVVYFVYGVVTYVIADGEEAKKAGKDRIIYGIIGFAVIIGLWGLVYIIVNTFGIDIASPTTTDLKGLLPQPVPPQP